MTKLEFGENGRCICSICKKSIPKDIERISFDIPNRFGGNRYIRICAGCIYVLNNQISKETLPKIVAHQI